MTVNAYLVLRDESAGAGWIDSFWRTAVEAAIRAATSSDLIQRAGAVSVPDSVVPGWYYDGTDYHVEGPLSGTGLINRRRQHLVPLLRDLERIGGMSAWISADLNGVGKKTLAVRAKSYARRLEMMTRAVAVDVNLLNDDTHKVILREVNHPGREWYWLHYAAVPMVDDKTLGDEWSEQRVFDMSRTGWVWSSTTGPDAFDPTVRIAAADALVPNTRGAITGPQAMNGGEQPTLDLNINWIDYLS